MGSTPDGHAALSTKLFGTILTIYFGSANSAYTAQASARPSPIFANVLFPVRKQDIITLANIA